MLHQILREVVPAVAAIAAEEPARVGTTVPHASHSHDILCDSCLMHKPLKEKNGPQALSLSLGEWQLPVESPITSKSRVGTVGPSGTMVVGHFSFFSIFFGLDPMAPRASL